MPKFVIFFSLSPQTSQRFIDNPSDRAAAGRALLEERAKSARASYRPPPGA